MSKNKTQIKYFHRGCYPVYVGVVFNEKELNRELKRLDTGNPSPVAKTSQATTFTIDGEDGRICIVLLDIVKLRKVPYISSIVSLCAHEATHVWQDVREYIGEERPAREQEAYYLQYITQCLVEALLSKLKIKDSIMKYQTKSKTKPAKTPVKAPVKKAKKKGY